MADVHSPIDNIAIQMEHNTLHRDGSLFSYAEIAKTYMKEFAAEIKQWEGPQSDPSLLDVGCRVGYAFFPFIEQFPASRVVGVDLVSEFVEMASSEAECHEGDVCALPFADEGFDYVFCSQTLEHAIYPELAAKELMRVAGKALYISVPIESVGQSEANPSHNMQTENPIDWLSLFKSPCWRLQWAKICDHEDSTTHFNFVLRRRLKDELEA